jgi:hypothetical protein
MVTRIYKSGSIKSLVGERGRESEDRESHWENGAMGEAQLRRYGSNIDQNQSHDLWLCVLVSLDVGLPHMIVAELTIRHDRIFVRAPHRQPFCNGIEA